MRLGVLFRIRYVVVSIALLLALHGSADALWLDVTGTTYPEPAKPFVSLEGKAPPAAVAQQGLVALPSYRDPYGMPRLAMQYRADFPFSITFATDGAIGGERVAPTGAFNVTTRVILTNAWWSPALSASFAGLSVEDVAEGTIEPGYTGLRSEWKVRF
jgi:hypothetical protein